MNALKSKILYLILIVISTGLLVFLVTLPLVSGIKENKKQLAAKQSDFTNNENRILNLKSMQKNKAGFDAKIENINNLWPDEKEVSTFIVDLENLANGQGVTLKNVTISEAATSASKSNNKVKQIQFSFDTKASFDQDLAIIKSMEKFPRFNSIGQITFNKDTDGSVLMKITGSIYYGQ